MARENSVERSTKLPNDALLMIFRVLQEQMDNHNDRKTKNALCKICRWSKTFTEYGQAELYRVLRVPTAKERDHKLLEMAILPHISKHIHSVHLKMGGMFPGKWKNGYCILLGGLDQEFDLMRTCVQEFCRKGKALLRTCSQRLQRLEMDAMKPFTERDGEEVCTNFFNIAIKALTTMDFPNLKSLEFLAMGRFTTLEPLWTGRGFEGSNLSKAQQTLKHVERFTWIGWWMHSDLDTYKRWLQGGGKFLRFIASFSPRHLRLRLDTYLPLSESPLMNTAATLKSLDLSFVIIQHSFPKFLQ